MNIGKQIDKLEAIRQDIAKVNAIAKKVTDKLKSKFDKLQLKIQKEMQSKDVEILEGELGRGEIDVTEHAVVKDWRKTWKWIVKNDAFDLVNKKINGPAFRARIAPTKPNGKSKKIPGISIFVKTELKITKRPVSSRKKTRTKKTRASK